jgi:dTDP-4-amino-4,6-dideoxygalactose transaminase
VLLLALMVLVSLYATYDIAVSLPKVAGLVYDFPVTESLGDMSLALPFSGVMSEEQVDYVCEHLVRLGHAGRRAPPPSAHS